MNNKELQAYISKHYDSVKSFILSRENISVIDIVDIQLIIEDDFFDDINPEGYESEIVSLKIYGADLSIPLMLNRETDMKLTYRMSDFLSGIREIILEKII